MAKSGSNSDDRTTEETGNHGAARKSRSKKEVPSEARQNSEKVVGGKIKAKSKHGKAIE